MKHEIRRRLLLMVRGLSFLLEEKWSDFGRPHDLTPAQQYLIYILGSVERPLSMTEISKIGFWHLSTVTRLIKPLVDRGWVRISQEPDQPKSKYATLTDAGQTALDLLFRDANELTTFPFDLQAFTEEEIQQFLKFGLRLIEQEGRTEYLEFLERTKLED
jgi:MarR family protease production transcriptional regulator HPr